MDEGAKLVAGGPGKPEGFDKGYFVKPTVFADVNNNMEIARTEIFGPVLSVMPFETEEQAIEIANDTPYGLTNYIQTQDPEKVKSNVRTPKTIGHGKVMPPNTRSKDIIYIYLVHMSEKVAQRLRRNALSAQNFFIGLKTNKGWIGNKKIASIGIKVSNKITSHGLALNINTDLSYFDHIIACGLAESQPTSLSKETNQTHDMKKIAYEMAVELATILGSDLQWDSTHSD